MNAVTALTQASEIAAAAWDAGEYQTPFLVVACTECQGTGTQRVYRSYRLHDYTDVACGHCDEGDTTIANPDYRG